MEKKVYPGSGRNGIWWQRKAPFPLNRGSSKGASEYSILNWEQTELKPQHMNPTKTMGIFSNFLDCILHSLPAFQSLESWCPNIQDYDLNTQGLPPKRKLHKIFYLQTLQMWSSNACVYVTLLLNLSKGVQIVMSYY